MSLYHMSTFSIILSVNTLKSEPVMQSITIKYNFTALTCMVLDNYGNKVNMCFWYSFCYYCWHHTVYLYSLSTYITLATLTNCTAICKVQHRIFILRPVNCTLAIYLGKYSSIQRFTIIPITLITQNHRQYHDESYCYHNNHIITIIAQP